MTEKKYIMWFEDIGIKDVGLVGGKNASLGEMIRNLSSKGVNVPGGFAITAGAYRYFLDYAQITDKIKEILSDLDTHDIQNLQERGRRVRDLIVSSELPPDLAESILKYYDELCKRYGQDEIDVAVRSSATAEDLPDASFAGQQETFLNIKRNELLDACKRCFASLFTDRAISYRVDKGFDHFNVYLSIGVQKMVRSDAACSGVMFSIDTESGFKDVVFITASYGLGESVVQGLVNPDDYYVFKPTLREGKRPIIGRRLGTKETKIVYLAEDEIVREPGKVPRTVKTVEVAETDRNKFVLTDDEVLTLARWGDLIEAHYTWEAKERAKREGMALPEDYLKPMDIEWAKDGDGVTVGTGELFIVQARPETVHSLKDVTKLQTYVLLEDGKCIIEGQAVGDMIGQGKANVITSVKDIGRFNKGEVLVTDMTDPDWEPIMKIASAIVTNRGGRTCHAAIISRELGIPCVIGTEQGTTVIKSGQNVTVSCAEGETGRIYDGLLKFEVRDMDLKELPRTKTKIMMNAGIPEKAFIQGQIPNDGVGLAREEFIINSYIGIHPNALIYYDELKKRAEHDEKIRKVVEEIDKRTAAYPDKVQYFIDNLAQGIGRIGAGFYPNDVIVRFSDFKTNEYANLIGGYLYEPEEDNPMLGWRGASRYYDKRFKEAFGLECKAILKVRNEMGLTNVKVMIPFCRTPAEGRKVIETMKEFGLVQGENGLEVYVMAEIPSNVVVAEQFAEIFDGFSIGSNDLTQLTLGLDRDSEYVAKLFDENEDAVKNLVAHVIKVAREKGRKIGICGQAPSDFPEFAEFLVKCGIDSISLNPDTVLKTRLTIARKEKELGIAPT
jgi:pyruvate,water dikinase